ncbi:MAG: ABC transporter ATP-binding protein [Acidobacteriota bacterium]
MSFAREEDHSGQGIQWPAWKRILRSAPQRWRLLLGISAAAIGTAVAGALYPLATKAAIDQLVEHGRDADLTGAGLAYLALSMLMAFSVWLFIRLVGRLSAHLAHDVRVEAFGRLIQLPQSYFDERPVGWLVSRMTSDCERLSQVLSWGFLDVLWGTTCMAMIGATLFIMAPGLALTVLVVLVPLFFVSWYFSRLILESARKVRKLNSRLTASFSETLLGARTAKSLACEDLMGAEFGELSGESHEASLRQSLQSAVYLPLVLLLTSVGTGLALWKGGEEVLAGLLTLGTLVAFLQLVHYFFEPVHEVAATFAGLQIAQAAAERITGLLETVPEVRDSDTVLARVAEQREAATVEGVAEDGGPESISAIELRDVRFSYSRGPEVLSGLNLRVDAGQTVALVGPTGGGKTTLIGLIARFHEPSAGELLLDGVDYRERSLDWWRSKLGIVLQDPMLFRGTVADNVRYGRLEATDAEIEEAVRTIGAESLLSTLPKGLESEVGEGGDRLSTGQKQLVSLARALLADPDVLILDEATSSVDAVTELAIQAGVRRLLAGRTAFVIAHRLSTIREADRILFIEKGRIVEDGSHRELLGQKGRYHDLAVKDLGGARRDDGAATTAAALGTC